MSLSVGEMKIGDQRQMVGCDQGRAAFVQRQTVQVELSVEIDVIQMQNGEQPRIGL